MSYMANLFEKKRAYREALLEVQECMDDFWDNENPRRLHPELRKFAGPINVMGKVIRDVLAESQSTERFSHQEDWDVAGLPNAGFLAQIAAQIEQADERQRHDAAPSLEQIEMVLFALRAMFQKNEANACPCCGCRQEVLPMDSHIAVGFGYAAVTRDGDEVYHEPTNDTAGCWTAQDAENLAKQNPDRDWRIHLVAPFFERHYQRQGDGHWVLYMQGKGFA